MVTLTKDNRILADRQKIISGLTVARMEKGISQQALADMIGTQRSNICRVEAGGQNISLDMLLKISSALGKEVSVILSDRKEEKENESADYSLRLYDDELMTFSLHREGLSGLEAKVLTVNDRYSPLFPLDLDISGKGIAR